MKHLSLFWQEEEPVPARREPGVRVPRQAAPPRPVHFERPADWQPHDVLPELHGLVAVDLETQDPGIGLGTGSSWAHAGVGQVCGVAVAWEGGDFYLPLAHSEGNVDADRVWPWLAAQLAKPAVTLCNQNVGYDLGWMRRHGIRQLGNAPMDTMYAATLLDEHRLRYGLDALAWDYLGERKNGGELIAAASAGGVDDAMSNMHRLPGWLVEGYARQDARLALRLMHKLLPLLEEQGLQRVWQLERECTLCSVDMRERGIKVDVERAERIKADFTARRDAALEQVRQLTGVTVSAGDNAEIARALQVETPGLQLSTTATGKLSVRKEQLAALQTPVAQAVLEARRLDKAIGTFIDGYIFGHVHNGRIHPEFHQLRGAPGDDDVNNGTISGRYASSKPNGQNLPARDPEVAEAVRGCFSADDGEVWYSLDYSSQEPRLTTDLAARVRLQDGQPLQGAAAMLQRYLDRPATDLHAETAALMGVPRQQAKAIFLGLAYGMGGAKLCRELGLPTAWQEDRNGRRYEVAGPEGQALLDRHMASVPFVRGFQKLCKEAAERRGYVMTITGRRLRFPRDPNTGRLMWTHAATNRVVQGGAADITKIAMTELRREGIPYHLTIHDSIEFSLPAGWEGESMFLEAKRVMESCVRDLVRVPMLVDAKRGTSWGALTKFSLQP